jgi:hypothetical protein
MNYSRRLLEYQNKGSSTSYPCAKGAQSNLIWVMRRGQQMKQKNPFTTWKQHGQLSFPLVSMINGLHGRL